MSALSLHSECVDSCFACGQICYKTAMNHCLTIGGEHVSPEHFKLLMNCAKLCEATACFQLTGSKFRNQLCKLCAEVCEACADSCEAFGDMDACVQACRQCAETCYHMAV